MRLAAGQKDGKKTALSIWHWHRAFMLAYTVEDMSYWKATCTICLSVTPSKPPPGPPPE